MATTTLKPQEAETRPVRASRDVVLQAVIDLCAANRQASRAALVEVTGLRLQIVDEHVKNLKEEGVLRVVIPGVFEPVDVSADRAISGTIVPTGRFKLEIGDVCLDLTLREARSVAVVTAGCMVLGSGWVPK